jgi:hypothetical protein
VALSIVWVGFLLLFPFTYGGLQPYQNFVLNAYFWLLTGVLFRLPALNNPNPAHGAHALPRQSVQIRTLSRNAERSHSSAEAFVREPHRGFK